MALTRDLDRRSRAAIGGHPIHPLLVPFPTALLATAAATDLMYVASRDESWARTSRWLLGAGVVVGGIAAPLGLIDFLAIGEARRHRAGWIHLLGNATALGLSAANLALRWQRAEAERNVLPLGLALSAATVSVLAATTWFGGELASRHGVGVWVERGERLAREPGGRPEARRRPGWYAAGPGVPVMAPDVAGTDSPELVALREADMPDDE